MPVIDELARKGLDLRDIHRVAGIDLLHGATRGILLDIDALAALLAAAGQLTGRSDLAFEMGLMLKPNLHGMLGYAMMCCQNLDQAVQLVCRHMPLVTDLLALRYQRAGRGGDAVLAITPAAAMQPPLMRAALEVAAAALHQHIVLLGAPRTAYEITLAMPQPLHQARYAELAPAFVQFSGDGMPGVTARFGSDLLDAPLPLSAPRVLAEIEDGLQVHGRRLPPGTRWADYILGMLRESQGRLPGLDDLARRLGVTSRTVDRHLAAEGVTFRDLSRAVRIDQARALLHQPGITVAQVAAQLGFGDAASFSRAFRRGAGMAPGEYRRRLQAQERAGNPPDTPKAL